ncbi:MAG: hypothetical protein OEZ34_05660 [Spirochaetia bacterium]|nr:hypothetical protein [Spirochaetia bacterium]
MINENTLNILQEKCPSCSGNFQPAPSQIFLSDVHCPYCGHHLPSPEINNNFDGIKKITTTFVNTENSLKLIFRKITNTVIYPRHSISFFKVGLGFLFIAVPIVVLGMYSLISRIIAETPLENNYLLVIFLAFINPFSMAAYSLLLSGKKENSQTSIEMKEGRYLYFTMVFGKEKVDLKNTELFSTFPVLNLPVSVQYSIFQVVPALKKDTMQNYSALIIHLSDGRVMIPDILFHNKFSDQIKNLLNQKLKDFLNNCADFSDENESKSLIPSESIKLPAKSKSIRPGKRSEFTVPELPSPESVVCIHCGGTSNIPSEGWKLGEVTKCQFCSTPLKIYSNEMEQVLRRSVISDFIEMSENNGVFKFKSEYKKIRSDENKHLHSNRLVKAVWYTLGLFFFAFLAVVPAVDTRTPVIGVLIVFLGSLPAFAMHLDRKMRKKHSPIIDFFKIITYVPGFFAGGFLSFSNFLYTMHKKFVNYKLTISRELLSEREGISSVNLRLSDIQSSHVFNWDKMVLAEDEIEKSIVFYHQVREAYDEKELENLKIKQNPDPKQLIKNIQNVQNQIKLHNTFFKNPERELQKLQISNYGIVLKLNNGECVFLHFLNSYTAADYISDRINRFLMER